MLLVGSLLLQTCLQRGTGDLAGENQWRHWVPHPHLVFTVTASFTSFSSGSAFSLLVIYSKCSHKSSSFYPGHPLPISSLLKLLLFHQHSWQRFFISPLYPILASTCCIYFLGLILEFFVLVNHEYACLFMVSLLVFWNTSFLCQQEVCSQWSDSILKLFCPSELHLTGSLLPPLNESKSVLVKIRVCTLLLAFLTSCVIYFMLPQTRRGCQSRALYAELCKTLSFILILQKMLVQN